MNSSIHFDCQGDEVVPRELFIAGAVYVFIAQAQHAVQPKGQELTFSKSLCRLLFLCGFFSTKDRQGGEEGREVKTTLVFT